MRYIGCKQRLLPFIHDTIKENNIQGKVFCDLFAGTATVGNYFKKQCYQIVSNDLLYSSYIMQYVDVYLNEMPRFEMLASRMGLTHIEQETYVHAIMAYLNSIPGVEGFIYNNFTLEGTQDKSIQRMYYSADNAKKIDAIRYTITAWEERGWLSRDEVFVLLYALIQQASRCANTTATMGSFLKSYAAQALRTVMLQVPVITPSQHYHHISRENGIKLIQRLEDIDILYLDPPYTEIQYGAAYHLLETIAWGDSPQLQGISGKRDVLNLYSLLGSKINAFQALNEVIASRRYKHLLLSYSSDGIISHETMLGLLERYGTVTVKQHVLRRYNTLPVDDGQRTPRNVVEERLYYLKPH